MIRVGFYLANKREVSSIDAIVRFSGKRYKYPAGISVKEKYWNEKAQRAREVKGYNDAYIINGRLDTVAKAMQDVSERFIATARIPTGKEFSTAVDNELNPGRASAQSELLTDFIERYYPTLTKAKNTVKGYITTLNALKEFEKDRRIRIQFSDVNMELYNELLKWSGTKNHSINTHGDLVKNIKVFFKAARANGLHELFIPDDFTNVSADSDSIYLNEDELKKITDLVINEKLILEHYKLVIVNVTGNVDRAIKSLVDCRDRFMIGAYTAMRFIDYSMLKGLKSDDQYIAHISEKTGVKTTIPMHPVIREILIRRNNILPGPVSNQKMNKQLKVLGKMAKLNEKVEITTTMVTGKERSISEKWELISTHTARRSGCTNMFLAGIEVPVIMSFSGHGTEKNFKKYIKANSLQVAMKAKDHPFFAEKATNKQ